jgi:hypothetical protein
MAHLNPNKLHVNFSGGATASGPITPRLYTLTHSDTTGDLFLTIGKDFNFPQISGLYTRLMRDEVLAEWDVAEQTYLHVHCHVSGGLVFGTSGMRYMIFRSSIPLVLEAFFYGDRLLLDNHPELANGQVVVHYYSRRKKYNRDETLSTLSDYRIY